MTHRTAPWVRSAAAAALVVAVPLAAATPPPPTAAAPCLSEAELRAMMAFAMPSALDGVISHCAPHLAAGGFLRREGRQLVAGYARSKAAAWPRARMAFLKLAGDKDPDSVAMVATMPDTALQPFVDGLIGGLVGAKLKPGQCVLAETMVRLLAPLPPENTVELLSTIVALAGAEAKTGAPASLAVCKG